MQLCCRAKKIALLVRDNRIKFFAMTCAKLVKSSVESIVFLSRQHGSISHFAHERNDHRPRASDQRLLYHSARDLQLEFGALGVSAGAGDIASRVGKARPPIVIDQAEVFMQRAGNSACCMFVGKETEGR